MTMSLDALRAARRVGFLFCGGASRAVFQVGVVEELAALGVEPQVCMGVSAGAWNAAAVAAGNRSLLRSYWRFFTRMPYVDMTNLVREKSPFIWNRLHERAFQRYVGEARLRRADTLPIFIAATRLRDRRQVVFDLRAAADPLKILLATNYLPPFYSQAPVIGGEAYGDGGFSDNAPYPELFARGCDAVVLISVKGESEGGIYRNADDYSHEIPAQYRDRVVVIRPRHRLPLRFAERRWVKLAPIAEMGRLRVREVLLGESHPQCDVSASGRSLTVHLADLRRFAKTVIAGLRRGPDPGGSSVPAHEHHVLYDVVEEHHDHQRRQHGDPDTHDPVFDRH